VLERERDEALAEARGRGFGLDLDEEINLVSRAWHEYRVEVAKLRPIGNEQFSRDNTRTTNWRRWQTKTNNPREEKP